MTCRSVFLFVLCGFCFTKVLAADKDWVPFIEDDKGLLFTLHGSNTLGARLVPAWAEDYLRAKGARDTTIVSAAQENEYRVSGKTQFGNTVYIHVAAHGSSTGFVSLQNGSADIAMSSRAIKDKEAEALAAFGNMRSFKAEQVVAIDGLAVIVNAENSINSLTVETIAKIFSGEIDNWQMLGGANRKINVYARDDKSGTWDTFKSLVLQDTYALVHSAKRFESNDELSDRVAADTSGIGFVGLASVRDAKVLAVSDGASRPLKPHVLYVATEDYPLARRLFLYVSPTRAHPYINEFLDFAHSDAGQLKVNDIGFVAQAPIGLPAEFDDSAPEDYVAIVQHAERLSLNFRFAEESADLDNKAQRDVLRLAEYLKRPENQNKHVQLIGFSDQKNSSSREMVLSRMRALMVQIALYKQGVTTENVAGFGGWLPVAENTGNGRNRNRRVEVWLYEPEVHAEVSAAKSRARVNEEKMLEAALYSSGLTATR